MHCIAIISLVSQGQDQIYRSTARFNEKASMWVRARKCNKAEQNCI